MRSNHLGLRPFLACICAFAFMPLCHAEATDAAYIEEFLKKYPKVEQPPSLESYATPAEYDTRFLGKNLEPALKKVSNNGGGIAWGLAYRMMSLNEMHRVTDDVKYLAANLECLRAVAAVRDDKQGIKLWTGAVAPAWSSDKYAERGRAVFAVHTGMITYPMLDCLGLVSEHADLRASLGVEYDSLLTTACEALAYHDRQWRDGPAPEEGHYIGMEQENVLENKPLPGNRLSAMGNALWASWKITGNPTHQDRALAIGRYIKNRLGLAPDGAYYWSYWLPIEPLSGPLSEKPTSGEDSSHGALTASFPLLLAREGKVFDEEDVRRFAKTVLNGVARLGGGIILGDVVGSPGSKPDYAGAPAKWLEAAHAIPEVRDRIVAFYLNYCPSPSPFEMALLIRHRKQ